MEVGDICTVKENSTWGNGKLRGKTVIIDKGTGSFSVREINGYGGWAWVPSDELEFVRHGTKEDIETVKKNEDEVHRRLSDLYWIRDNWDSFKDGISGTSMLALFNAIGYQSPFERNGEYFVLYEDWIALRPIFNAIMSHNLEEAISVAKTVFVPKYVDEIVKRTNALYEKLNVIKV
jgi:hypothetical protein